MPEFRWGCVAGVVLATALAGCRGGTVEPAGTPAPMGGTVVGGVDPGLALQERVSLDVEGLPLTQVAAQLARSKSVEIVYDDRVNRKDLARPVTLRLEGVLLESALYWLVADTGLNYYFDENRVVLATPERITPERQEQLKRLRTAMEHRWRPALEKKLAGQISCDVQELTLAEAMEPLREHYGVNFVGSPELLGAKVTVKAEERPMTEVLDALGKSAGANWTLEHEAIHFQRAGQ